MNDIVNWAVANSDTLLGIATALLTAAALIVKLTPTPKDDEIVGKVQGFFVKIAALMKPKAKE